MFEWLTQEEIIRVREFLSAAFKEVGRIIPFLKKLKCFRPEHSKISERVYSFLSAQKSRSFKLINGVVLVIYVTGILVPYAALASDNVDKDFEYTKKSRYTRTNRQAYKPNSNISNRSPNEGDDDLAVHLGKLAVDKDTFEKDDKLSALDQEREELIERIIDVTHVELSPIGIACRNPVLQEIHDFLFEPEMLLVASERDRFLLASSRTTEHPFFGGIIAKEKMLAEKSLCPPEVLTQYKNYREYCITLQGDDLLRHLTPKAILYIDDQRVYRIDSSLSYQINSINEYNISQRENDAGNHAVCCLGQPGRRVHFKNNNCHTDLSPAMESAMYGFYTLIAPNLVTPSFFMRIEGLAINRPNRQDTMNEWNAVEQGTKTLTAFRNDHADKQADLFITKPQNFILQGSRTAEGMRFDQFLEQVKQGQASYDAINRESFSYHILLSLLFNPSDYKADNLFLSPEGYIEGIDNDGCLADPIVYIGTKKREYHVGVKNILYLLPLMEETIHENVIKTFKSLNVPLTFLRWISFLESQDKRYQPTFDPQGLERGIEDEDSFPVRLVPGTMTALYDALRDLQKILWDSWGMTHQQLLMRFQPLVKEAYQAYLKRDPDPLTAMSVIYNRTVNLQELLPNKAKDLQREAQSKDAYTLNRTASLSDEIKAVLPKLEEDDAHLAQILDYLVCYLPDFVTDLPLTQDPERFKRMLAVGASIPSLRCLLTHQPQNAPLMLGCQADDWLNYAKSFMPQISFHHLKGDLNPVVSIVLNHFNEWVDELLPILQENAWHQIVQEQNQGGIYNEAVFNFLMRRSPLGVNGLIKERSPLDEAFDYLLKYPEGNCAAEIIADLINRRGAWQMSLSGRQYRDLKKRDDLLPSFWQSFHTLQERNAKVGWTVTLEEIFPLAPSPKQQTGQQNTIQGTSGETRTLTTNILKQLEDPNHEITQGRRKVVRVESNGCFAFIKFYPELVGLEEAVGELTRRMIGFGAPHGELFKFPDGRPAWVSQGIPGDTLQWVLTNDPNRLEKLDPVSTTKFILMAMLTNPEDGKPDNYIVEPLPGNPTLYRLSSPDNDHGFVPAFVKTKPNKGGLFSKPELVVQVKTILYCLDLMNQPIPEETKALFLNGDPLILMQEWLDVLDRRNRHYETLYSSKEAAALFKGHQCFMGVPFQKGMISHLYSKWVRFQDCLWEKSLTPLGLLNKVEPRLANRYRASFENSQNKTVWDRFKWVDGDFYHQTGATITPSGAILTSQNIPMHESALESIRNGQGLGPKQAITELKIIVEQKKATGLSIGHMVTDSQREDFLKEFDFGQLVISAQRNIVNELIPHAANLRRLILKNCAVLNDDLLQKSFLLGDLVCLDLNGCAAITHDILSILSRNMPGLEVLNLANLPKLRWVANAGVINYDTITFRQLRKLNLSNCTALEAIDIDVPNLENLWANGAKKLELLKLKSNMNDEVFYNFLNTIESPNLNAQKVEFTNCLNITKGAKAIFSAFVSSQLKPLNLSQLESLDLSGYQIGAAGIELLVTKINLQTVSINPQDLKHFLAQSQNYMRIVKVKGGITDLELYDMLLSSITLTEVDNLLPTNLEVVDLKDCPNITAKSIIKDLGKALEQKDSGAQYRLGVFLFRLKGNDECMGWFEKAANQGNVAAHNIMKNLGGVEMRLPIPIVAQGYEAIYQRFLKGVLIYRPQQGSDVGRIDLPIAALGNPLEGMFDLSQCGDAGKYLSISTGYRKGMKAENANKVEIWLAPRFLIKKELKTTAAHFQKIMGNWNDNNPVGMFWTWGGWSDLEYYDSLITENMYTLSNATSLIYAESVARFPNTHGIVRVEVVLKRFHVHFMN